MSTCGEETISDVLKNRVVFFSGYPGSGKGTQGKRLADDLKIQHLSTGELFRAEVAKETEIGCQMDVYMKSGQVIPKELVFGYLRAELSKPVYKDGFIMDGYPKNLESYEFIMKTLGELQLQPLAALHFDVSRDLVIQRLMGRLHCNQCEHDFHPTLLPPKKENECDHCTGPLVARPDDTQEAIGKRLDVFEKATAPVLNQFTEAELLFRINCSKNT